MVNYRAVLPMIHICTLIFAEMREGHLNYVTTQQVFF